jgi:acetyl esterase/lipase
VTGTGSLRALASALALVFALGSPAQAQAPAAQPLSWEQVAQMKLPPPDAEIPYGSDPHQFGELRIPAGGIRSPVLILVHGGCWESAYDYHYMTHLAYWFVQHGVATWTIEYRRVGDAGGGWPHSLQDVATAADALRNVQKTHDSLDLRHVYVAGHSSGAQLALWLASRDQLPEGSELYRERPLEVRGVLALSAITDLEKYREGPAGSCHASVDKLLGGDPQRFPRRYRETSPSQRLPLGVPQVFVQGERDPIVDGASVRAYVDAASKAGDRTLLLSLPEGGHFEPAIPGPQSEAALQKALDFLLKGSP